MSPSPVELVLNINKNIVGFQMNVFDNAFECIVFQIYNTS